ncbi:tetratricopeptide repeat protein [Massilia atriviolacea]|uniref:Tetratricopeptide repeat protein n=1 Tax=Massilia atriviolacea TaxID=2495579 RepID=A0A430HPD9_9BURK|nr:LytR C-terminal domain-containing protein [Massilia atriviolacea]RSZ59382.1 tetratricopeptide repeat protein [Massilia atriviolacea]
MPSPLTRYCLLCAGALLLACAGPRRELPDTPDAPDRPDRPDTPAAAPLRAEDAYLKGRDAHLARRHAAALAAYRAALARDPAHLKARNGLATLYAEQGDFERAIALWEAMTQEGEGAGGQASAFLFSNLGYAHFLNGQFGQALAALEKACLLDPLNARAWDHLGGALDKLGQHQRAEQMYRQASALRSHDFRADYAVAERAGVAAIDSAVKADAQGAPREPQWARTEVQQDGAGVFVLRRVGEAAPAVAAVAAPRSGQALLEIRNGNGVTGMARSLAATMDASAVRVVRLSNQKGFGVRRTRIEYQGEFREAAERLAERFGAARVVAVGDVGRADLRLVIGRDLAPGAAAGVAVAVRTRPLAGQG